METMQFLALAAQMGGVLSKSDLQTMLAEPTPPRHHRMVKKLEQQGILRRFMRGLYVLPDFEFHVLAQRIAPQSYVSCEAVLSRALLIGPAPEKSLTSVRVGRTRTYENLGYRLTILGIKKELYWGFENEGFTRRATPEKAALDCLYFYQHGRSFLFDVYSDVQYDDLDRQRLASYLKRYRNRKFVSFAKTVMGI